MEIDLSAGAALTYLSTAVAFVGPLLGPVVGASANVFARLTLQRRIWQAEYDCKRLDLVEKALAVEKTLGDKLQTPRGTDVLLAEYRQVISSIASNRARQDAEAASQSERRRGMRALILPWPLSMAGWFASAIYYTYAFLALVFVIALILAAAGGPVIFPSAEFMGRPSRLDPYWLSLYHAAIRSVLFAAIAWLARSWALRNCLRCRARYAAPQGRKGHPGC
jgi:hypothetical protein